jgi:uncharacterized iron-regulated protein
MKRTIIVALFAASLVMCTRVSTEFYRVIDKRTVPFRAMMQELRSADIIVVGELHDSSKSHEIQLQVIRAMRKSGVSMAIGLEMFRAEDQAVLDGWVAGDLDQNRFIRRYYDNWRMPWPLYRDIFLYARKERIPLIGLNIPDAVSDSVAKKGFGSLTREQRAQIPSAVSCNVDPRYRAFIRDAYSDHGPMSDRSFNNFCEAQLLWDRTMAWHLAAFRARHPEKHIIVLTGTGHAWRRGIAEQLPLYAKLSIRVVLPEVEGYVDPENTTIDDADYIVLD